jgi:hypothetical protein
MKFNLNLKFLKTSKIISIKNLNLNSWKAIYPK